MSDTIEAAMAAAHDGHRTIPPATPRPSGADTAPNPPEPSLDQLADRMFGPGAHWPAPYAGPSTSPDTTR